MSEVVTRWRKGEPLQEIAADTGLTVKEVIAVLRENSKQWDGVNAS